jgi:hypothetical protein
MPGLVKIGFTTDTAEARAKELSNHTGVPTPFEVAWCTERIADPQSVEKEVHRRLVSQRTNRGREFFKIETRKVISIIEHLAGADHQNALEAKRIAEEERKKQQNERNHQWTQSKIREKLIEKHREQSTRLNIAEDEKTITAILRASTIIAPIGYFLNQKIDLHWSIPIVTIALYWYVLAKKEKKAPIHRIEIEENRVSVDCFRCRKRVFIDSRFMQDNPNTKCSCPNCGFQLT